MKECFYTPRSYVKPIKNGDKTVTLCMGKRLGRYHENEIYEVYTWPRKSVGVSVRILSVKRYGSLQRAVEAEGFDLTKKWEDRLAMWMANFIGTQPTVAPIEVVRFEVL